MSFIDLFSVKLFTFLQRQLDGLDVAEQEAQDSYVKNQQDEQTSLAKLQEKYGDGSYDTKNNEFTKQS